MPALRGVQDDKACLGKRVAEVTKRLRPLLFDVIALQRIELSGRFRSKPDHRG